ncbi:unnamed protein product [Schistosoma curassoni]|uniref:Uncharacterized protein n=1 Tax=Schistosoma curassoni TaxID=6186 RepID=A0A183JYZ6_9TREM|nr:unnamed protein product [Schistosoma curassoni]
MKAIIQKTQVLINSCLCKILRMGENKLDPNGGGNQEEVLGVDRIHIEESFQPSDKIVVGVSQHETLDPGFVLLGTHQQGVLVILRELVLPDGFVPVSPSFTIRDITTELSGP